MSEDVKTDDTKVVDLKEKRKAEVEQAKAEKEYKKQAATDLAAYKKQLKEGNELKLMQIEELELNIRYYDAKRKWLDLQSEVDKLEAEEQVLIKKERKRQAEFIELQKKAALKKAEENEKVDLVIPEIGKSRPK